MQTRMNIEQTQNVDFSVIKTETAQKKSNSKNEMLLKGSKFDFHRRKKQKSQQKCYQSVIEANFISVMSDKAIARG